MNEVNEKIAEYEAHLRDAELAVEKAAQAICSLRGSLPRYALSQTLEGIQALLRGAWQLYDNPDIEEA